MTWTAAPAGDFSLAFDGGLTLAYADADRTCCLTFTDDGVGYPPAVLHALQTDEAGENTPHILGLHVVEQIIRAHGGTAAFARNAPRGAKAVLVLPVTEDPAAR